MKEFLVTQEEEFYCVIEAKSKKQARQKFINNYKEWNPTSYQYIIDSLNGTEEFYFWGKICDSCTNKRKDKLVGTCDGECTQSKRFLYNFFINYFDGNEDLAKKQQLVLFDENKKYERHIEELANFIAKKDALENIQHYVFTDMDTIPKRS